MNESSTEAIRPLSIPTTFATTAKPPEECRPLLVPIARSNRLYRRTKRATDVIVSFIALIVLAPIFLVIAIAIFLTSGRPVIFRQTRLGLGCRPFTMFKFRTMVLTADAYLAEARGRQIAICPSDPIVKPGKESRLFTPIGHLLRTSSLDELPQFWNVLRGSMSLVGPRPPLPQETLAYTPIELRRLSVMPGMTGPWQVSGRSNLSFAEWMALDLNYIDKRTFWLDVVILLRTLPAVLSRSGAR